MSNKPDKDNELSALLNQAEPPMSPAHLDAAILQYAREHAPETAAKHGFPGDLGWLQRHWVPAAVTFSVAAIAVSVSLQLFTDPELASPSAGNRTVELALRSAEVEADTRRQISGVIEQEQQATADTGVANSPASAAPVLAQEVAQEVAELIANDVDAPSSIVATATSDFAIAADAVAAQTASRSVARELAAEPVTEAEANLASIFTADSALQDSIIIALRRALGMREQNSVVRRGQFPDEVRPYIETYRDLRDATILANVQNRYSVAKADLLETRLPETIEELVSILESL